MEKKLRQAAKTGIHMIRKVPKVPKTPRVFPPDLMLFLDSEVQLELLKRELERTAGKTRTVRTTASQSKVSDTTPMVKMAALA